MILLQRPKVRFKEDERTVTVVCRIQTLVSIVVGLWFIGPNNFLPWNSDWLLPTPDRVDHAVAQLNWEFFRNAPLVQWPPVLLPDLGVGWGTVYVPFSSGSLMGVPLKYIEFVLPEHFQFLGIWLIFSFAMLGFWSVRLVSRLTHDQWELWAGSALLLFSPTIFYRIGVLGHFELSAHWLLFAAIYLYLDRNFIAKQWSVLCIVTLVVNVYLFVMVFGIFIATIARHLKSSAQKKTVLLNALVVVISSFIVFVLGGFLSYRSNSQGLGFFRSNGATFIYPNFSLGSSASGSFSRILDWSGLFINRPFVAYEREGFNFLGSGVLIGSLIASALLFLRVRRIGLERVMYMTPLLIVSLLFFVNALSPKIVIGRRELLNLDVPQFVIELRQIFRTGERFVWPLAYVFIFCSVALIIKLIQRKGLPAILLVGLLIVQIVDSSNGIFESRRMLTSQSTVQLIDVANWSDLLRDRRHIALVPTFDYISDYRSPEIEAWLEGSKYFALLELAARTKSSTNFSVTGRPVTRIVDEENLSLENALSDGNFDRATVYVFASRDTWREIRSRFSGIARFEARDGYFIAFSK